MPIFEVLKSILATLANILSRIGIALKPVAGGLAIRFLALFGMMWEMKGKIFAAFFLIFLLTPLWTSMMKPMDNLGNWSSGVVAGFGESIAKPDIDIQTQIGLLKTNRAAPTPDYALNYLLLFSALMEFGVLLFVMMRIQASLFLANESAMFSLGNILLLIVIYGLVLNAYAGIPPFAGWWQGDNSILANYMILLDPITPVYQFYAYLQNSAPIVSLIL